MSDIEQFLNAPPIDLSLDDIRAALDREPYAQQIHNPDEEMFPSGYDLKYRSAAVLIPIWREPESGDQSATGERKNRFSRRCRHR